MDYWGRGNRGLEACMGIDISNMASEMYVIGSDSHGPMIYSHLAVVEWFQDYLISNS